MKVNASSRRAALLCCAVLLSLGPAPAQKPVATGIEGTYVLNDPAAETTVKKAIDAAVKGMGWFAGRIAKARLEKTNLPPYQRIIIRVGAQVSDVSITTDNREPIVTPADGAPIDWPREDKEKLKVSTTLTLNVGPLKQTFKSEDGERVNTYTVSADGKSLTMQVVVSSPRLPRAVTYTLAYRRSA